jgi:hypothetical protein
MTTETGMEITIGAEELATLMERSAEVLEERADTYKGDRLQRLIGAVDVMRLIARAARDGGAEALRRFTATTH